MDLFTEEQKEILFANSKDSNKEQVPVASLYYAGSMDYRMLISSVDPKDKRTAYGILAFNGVAATLQRFNLNHFIELAQNMGSTVLAEADYHAERPLSDFLLVAKDQKTLNGLTDEKSPCFKALYEALSQPVPPA